MKVIKTYDHVNRLDKNLSFSISRMEDIYDKRQGIKDEAHRHDFYTILLIKRGKGEHIIDFNAYKIAENQVYFINPGQVHQLIENEKSYGYAITFSQQFLAQNNISPDFIDDLNISTILAIRLPCNW